MASFLYGSSDPTYYVDRSRYTPYNPETGYEFGQSRVIELLVPMCCLKCEEKIYEEMMELRGIQGVMVDRQAQRVVVHGFVDPLKALKRAKKVKKDSQLWRGAPYGEHNVFSSSKYRRSAYRSPSIYRSSSFEYRPSAYRASSSAYGRPSVYRSSLYRYSPAYGPASSVRQSWSVYDDMYSPGYLHNVEYGYH